MDDPSSFAPLPVRKAVLETIEAELERAPETRRHVQIFEPGESILKEGSRTGRIGLILEGSAALIKRGDEGIAAHVDTVGRGEFIGLLSYLAREINFVGVEAATTVRIFLLEWDAFEALQGSSPAMSKAIGQLMRDNLTGRYRRLLNVHMDVARLNEELASERKDLQATITELNLTRSRLVNQEKLAMLGKIVAGLAHELNNPVAAISRNTEYLYQIMETVVGASVEGGWADAWAAARNEAPADSRALHARVEIIQQKFPKLPRALARRVAAMPPELVEQLAKDAHTASDWERLLIPYEAGRFLRTLDSASDRIARLVRSLKNYARPDSNNDTNNDRKEPVDVIAGLQDTLLILAHHLRPFEVITEMEPVSPVIGNAGELNQVWTNLIVNAYEAMKTTGRLFIRTRQLDDGRLSVVIADNGPGIPPDKIESIFEPHFTTKAEGGDFGLGLGLSIAREIILKHRGTLSVSPNTPTGARFEVQLPGTP